MSATALLNLRKAGFTDAQVTALAQYFDSQMATKADIAELKGDLAGVRAEPKLDIERLRSDLELKIAGLDLKIADSKSETVKRVAGLLIAQGAAIVALIRVLPGMHP